MRILTRYIFKEIFSHSLLGMLVFTFVIFVRHAGQLLELVVRHDLPASSLLTILLLPVPAILVLTIPMSVLLGTLIGLSRMVVDGEVVAIRAAGIGLEQFVRPVMIFALAGWLLTSVMSLFLAPDAARKMNQMEAEFRTREVPYEIQPRVFIEQFPNLLLYVQDATATRSRWRGVFFADTSNPNAPKVTLAESGLLVNERSSDQLTIHLDQGTTHEIDPLDPRGYSVGSFNQTDIPLPMEEAEAPRSDRLPVSSLGFTELEERCRKGPDRQVALVEWHYRLALPVASLVLAMAAIPLGIYTRKGGKAAGLILTMLLVFAYYIAMAGGMALAKQGRIAPIIGLWTANAVFFLAGLAMLTHMRSVRTRIQALQTWLEDIGRGVGGRRWFRKRPSQPAPEQSQATRGRMIQILDVYILRGWLFYFLIMVAAFTGIYLIADFFQLLGDMVRNQASLRVVLDYYGFLLPQIFYFPVVPLSALVATLVNFSLMSKSNQVTAMKSAGISLYRVATPVLIVCALLSVGLFFLDDQYLPASNRHLDALRNQIKGRPAQTTSRPGRQWIFGQSSRMFHYRFFDSDRNVFGNLDVFEFDSKTFRITRRIHATRAFWEPPVHAWLLENGWMRDFDGDRITNYFSFSVATFNEFTERPEYFNKEVKPSAEMSARQLGQYIDELGQSGFDVVRLSVQLERKFAFPLVALVAALIGVPFAFTMGKQGAISGIAVSILIALFYWAVSSLFEAMGNLNQLPPALAAWSPDLLFGLGGVYLFLRAKS